VAYRLKVLLILGRRKPNIVNILWLFSVGAVYLAGTIGRARAAAAALPAVAWACFTLESPSALYNDHTTISSIPSTYLKEFEFLIASIGKKHTGTT
jgi:hypothetical protein